MKTRYSNSTGTFYPFEIDYPALPPDLQEISQADYDAAMARPSGSSFSFDAAGKLTITPAAPPSAAQLWAEYQGNARAALGVSDVTIIRCVENGVPVPAEWAQYRAALRAIVAANTGTPGTLPAKPAYPAGT